MERLKSLEEAGLQRDCGVLIGRQIYVVKKLLNAPKHDWIVVEDDTGRKFQVLPEACQRIDKVFT